MAEDAGSAARSAAEQHGPARGQPISFAIPSFRGDASFVHLTAVEAFGAPENWNERIAQAVARHHGPFLLLSNFEFSRAAGEAQAAGFGLQATADCDPIQRRPAPPPLRGPATTAGSFGVARARRARRRATRRRIRYAGRASRHEEAPGCAPGSRRRARLVRGQRPDQPRGLGTPVRYYGDSWLILATEGRSGRACRALSPDHRPRAGGALRRGLESGAELPSTAQAPALDGGRAQPGARRVHRLQPCVAPRPRAGRRLLPCRGPPFPSPPQPGPLRAPVVFAFSPYPGLPLSGPPEPHVLLARPPGDPPRELGLRPAGGLPGARDGSGSASRSRS